MNFARVCYFLIALLVCQTAVAFYDSHQELQDITRHVPAHHQDAADGSIHRHQPGSAEHAQPDKVQDCHHCCHCHGAGSLGLLTKAIQWLPAGAQVLHPSSPGAFYEGHFSALLRPPIA